MTSNALGAALRELTPIFERDSGDTLVIVSGGSVAGAPDSIPDRLARGEQADVVIMAGTGIDDLIKTGRLVSGSRADLARSSIGVAVRAGAPRPDISSVEALTRALLQAKSVAYSASVSGVYISSELFPRLGIAAQMRAKSRKIESEPVGVVVARGDAEIGFQQISELASRRRPRRRRPTARCGPARDRVLGRGRHRITQPQRWAIPDRVPDIARRLVRDREQRNGADQRTVRCGCEARLIPIPQSLVPDMIGFLWRP